MRKLVLFLLLVVLLGALTINAAAATAEHPHNGDHCVCGGSAVGVHDHKCASITWSPMPTDLTDFSKLSDGNYYLTQDLTVTGVTSFSNKKLTICLNGYNINTTTNAVFGYAKQGSVLNFCDCSGKQDAQGNWTWGGTVTANQAGKARSYGGIVNMNANTTLNVYGGNYVGSTGGSGKQGGAFNICNDNHGGATGDQNKDIYDTSFNFYNGHIIGGSVATNGAAINTWHYVDVNLYGGSITGGTGTSRGNLNISPTTTMVIENCTITGGNPGSVFVMNGTDFVTQCSTLAEALTKVKDGQHIRLLGDMNEAVTISDGICIDLAGNELSDVTLSGTPVFFDSATNGYRGDLAGKLTPVSGTPAMHTKQNGKRYLTIEEEGTYSFHRFYIGITKITLKPGTAGMGYKATFAGSEQVKTALSTATAYGYSMWLTEDAKLQKSYPASRFGGTQELTLRIDNFLNENLSATENEERANQKVYASAYVRLADGTIIESAAVSYSFREMLELADQNYTGFSASQQTALASLSAKFSGSMLSWDISNTHHAEGSIWQEMDNAAFNKLLPKQGASVPSGNYVLTEDVKLTYGKFKLPAGNTVNICLNGHNLSCDSRIFNTYGNLNICDCHLPAQEGSMLGNLNVAETAKNYASIVYCYYGSVTNLYGGNLISTGKTTNAGVLAVSHDGKDGTASIPAAIFNMYGGTVSGGNTYSSGGNISLFNGGVFNLYDGTIEGGTSGTNGGNISNGTYCTFNMYGGTIKGGIATTNGGNIQSTGTLNIYGGTIEGGTAKSGGNIHSTKQVSISGGTVEGGTAQYGLGGNIYAEKVLDIANASITGGNAIEEIVDGVTTIGTGLGDGIYVAGQATVSGDLLFKDNTGTDIYLSGNSTFDAAALSQDTSIVIDGYLHCQISQDPAMADRFTTTMEGAAVKAINGGTAIVPENIDPTLVTKQDSVFRVGYSMVDITPQESGLVMSSWGNPNGRKTNGVIGYTPYITAVALTDQENNTILMITVDLQNPPPESVLPTIYKLINQVTGIPETNIYISATHTHNVPSTSDGSAGNLRYRYLVIDALLTGAMEAMADRSEATMKTGSFDTVGMNYSRHYYYYDENGEKQYFGDQFGQKPADTTFYRVREGDTTMHMMAFERTDKQPVLVVNWRAHPHRSGGKTSYTVDADVIGATREYMHANTDYLFAYFQGAAGNMNTTSRISGETYKSGKITEYGNELGRQIRNGMNKLEPAETGLIQTKQIMYAGVIDHSQDDKYEQAVALRDYYNNNPEEMSVYENQIAKAAEFGFTSVFHATRLITKYNSAATRNMNLNIFSIGDSIAFYTAPAELWDSFSEEIEGISPFETTFCIGYCNGGVAYIPYKLDYFVSYEYFYCLFTQEDTINQMREMYLENLEEQYENAQ